MVVTPALWLVGTTLGAIGIQLGIEIKKWPTISLKICCGVLGADGGAIEIDTADITRTIFISMETKPDTIWASLKSAIGMTSMMDLQISNQKQHE